MNGIKGMVIVIVALSFATAGWAEDVVEGATETIQKWNKHGIRVGIRNAPGADEFEVSLGGASSTEELDPQDGGQIDVMYVRRHMGADGKNMFGPMWGAGLFIANSSGTEIGDTGEVELSAFGIIGEGGVAAQLGDVVVLELMPFLGFGGAAQEITGYTTGGASYLIYGIKGGLFFRLGSSIELGLEAGYSGFASEGQVEEFGITYDVTFTGGGFQGAGVLVFKF